MTDRQLLKLLLEAEESLKKTTRGYTPTGIHWRAGMPRLWTVRVELGKGDKTDQELGLDLAIAHGLLKDTDNGWNPRAHRWREAMLLIDHVEDELLRPDVPKLGPIVAGGKSLLLYQLTHNTDGVTKIPSQPSLYPATDDGWMAGLWVVAPEDMTVTRQSSAQGADAFWATGASKLQYWVGHITRAPSNGVRLKRGQRISTIAFIPGADHVHWGINARPLIGKDLLYGRNGRGPDYTFGSPTVGAQLAAVLV